MNVRVFRNIGARPRKRHVRLLVAAAVLTAWPTWAWAQVARDGSVSSGQSTAIDGSVSSGCATAINDSTASGGNCPTEPSTTTTPTTLGERIIDRIVPTPTTVVVSPPPRQPAQPSAPRQLALTG